MAKTWWIVWADGRERDPKDLPKRPPGAVDPTGGPFTPYYDDKEHRHDDGSFHVEAETKEEAVKKAKRGLVTLPLRTPSGRLPVQQPMKKKPINE